MGRKVGMNDMWDAMCHEDWWGRKGREKREKEKEKKEERQRKGKKTSISLINKERSYSCERICTSRGRGSLLLWLIFISEP